jgi:hypothetical protein
MLRRLDAYGLHPGALASVVERDALGGVTVDAPGGRTVLPVELARLIAVAAEAGSALSA